MILLHVSSEAVGPAFLEAALIHKYKGISNVSKSISTSIIVFNFVLIILSVELCPRRMHCIQGVQGCRNERDGGETVSANGGGPFFTYVVYQSFKRPSDAHLIRSSIR